MNLYFWNFPFKTVIFNLFANFFYHSQGASANENSSEHSIETVGLGRFFNFVISLERIVKERLFVKELNEKCFFRTFSDFVQAVFMDGNPANDVFIYDL